MGFFKWLDKHIRDSNEKWEWRTTESPKMKAEREEREAAREAREAEERSRCCANCYFFEEFYGGKYFWCRKNDFCFDRYEAENQGIHYTKICNLYERKY